MDETWERVAELFDAARARPIDQREAWVRSACTDERIRADVLSLLRVYEQDPDFLEHPITGDQITAALDAATPSPEGRRIGPYRLIREIGRGGMGVVYEAEQTDEAFSRRVAIKLVPSGWSSASLTVRFRYERQVLARLDHPGIARLLDAGTTDDGTPYFVMEYVDGQPIDIWCRQHSLAIDDRVTLLLQVADAVDYAHRHLIVHRDLKATNILVDAEGRPKLLDFGIAKMLSDEAELSRRLTGAGQLMFTPEYASPEQMRGERITTAADVYSLGVLLYVLLAERPPHEVADLSPFEAIRTVSETDAPAPSAVAPLDRRRRLHGDLDNIVLKTLRKDPQERYPSVHALADDLRAWLEGRAVAASPATAWYRARKFMTTHKVQSVAASAVVVSLAAGGTATAWQAHVARRERDKAESRFRDVRVFSRSLLFELHDAIRGLPGSTAARQLLVARATEFLDRLSKDAGDDRALKLELAEGYRRLGQVQGSGFTGNVGDTAGSVDSFRKATALGEDVLTHDPASTDAAILLTGAYDDLSMAWLRRNNIEQAEQAYQRHLAIVEQLERSRASDARVRAALASSYSNLAYFRGQRSDRSGAKTLYVKSIDLAESLPAEQRNTPDAIGSLSFSFKRLGAILLVEGHLEEAQARYEAALALDEQLIARYPDNAGYRYDLTFSLNDLGLIARRRADFARAEALYARALAIRQAALTADPKDTRSMDGVANNHKYLGGVYLSQKRIDEAIEQLRAGLSLQEKLVIIRGPLPADLHARAIAQVYLAQALLDRAEMARPGSRRTGLISEAGRLLTLAEPEAHKPPSASFVSDAQFPAYFDKQIVRFRHLGG